MISGNLRNGAFVFLILFLPILSSAEEMGPQPEPPPTPVNISGLPDLWVEVTGFKSYPHLESFKNSVLGFLPKETVFFEKNLRRGWVRFLLKTPMSANDFIQTLRATPVDGTLIQVGELKDQTITVKLDVVKKDG